MMSAITDVDCNFAVHCVKNRMPCVAFKIICGFVEVSHSGNVVLQTAAAQLELHDTEFWNVQDRVQCFALLPILIMLIASS